MKFDQSEIDIFEKVIVRTPTLPLSKLDFENLEIEKMMENDFFCKALYIANSKVYDLAIQYLAGISKGRKKDRKLKKTISNYYIRIHEKSVPFGFFANVFTGTWADKSSVKISPPKPKIRFDMVVTNEFFKRLNEDSEIRAITSFYPNNTLYTSGEKLRYNEIYFEDNVMSYKLSEVEMNLYLEKILEFSSNGKTLNEIAKHVHEGVYDFEDILEFVNSIANEQILISEFQMNISGLDPLVSCINRLKELSKKYTSNEKIIYFIKEFETYLTKLKELETTSEFIKDFNNLKAFFEIRGYVINPKTFIQVDCFSEAVECTFNNEIKENLYEGIKIVSAFKYKVKLPYLIGFKKKFNERYEDALVPLLDALDTDTGISYGDFEYQNDNIFTSELAFAPVNSSQQNVLDSLSDIKVLLYKKYIESLQNNKNEIEIFEKDVANITDYVKDLATTFQVIFNHINESDDKINLHTIGNSCAGSLISRFSYGSHDIADALIEIAEFEKSSYAGATVAEIVHIPQYRMGNITFRPRFRDYEIPIVTRSQNSVEKQIQLSDIYVTVSGDRIVLISKELKTEIIPKLTNAHNYGKDTLPVYQFLCELAYQNILPDLQVNKGLLDYIGKYVPRITYKNIVLTRAQWTLEFSDLNILLKEGVSIEDMRSFTKKWQVPRYTLYHHQNKTTLTDWESLKSLSRLLQVISKDDVVFLQEFPFDSSDGLIKDSDQGVYNNEVICVVKNKLRKNQIYKPDLKTLNFIGERNHVPGGKWIYLKIYLGYKSYFKFMTEKMTVILSLLSDHGLIEDYFFLPFTDSEFHLRIRIFIADDDLRTIILKKILALFLECKEEYNIHKIVQDTYKQEIERYGHETIDFAEKLFAYDSQFLINNFTEIFNENKFILPLKVMKQIDMILDGFKLSLTIKRNFLKYIQNNYASEFGVQEKNEVRSKLDSLLRQNRHQIESYLDPDKLESNFSSNLLDGFEKYKQSIQTTYPEFKTKFTNINELLDFLRSILHMHCIRCFVTAPRQNELFVYTALTDYYNSVIHRQKVSA